MSPRPLKTLIVDDEEHCRNRLKRLVLQYCPQLEVIASVDSAAQARNNVFRYNPELIFLDVEMPDEDGFDLLDQLETRSISIIFTTAFERYALPALKKQAVDYLLKPIEGRELIAAVNKLSDKPGENSPGDPGKIALPTLNGLVFHHAHEIIRCQAEGAYTHVFRDEGSLLISRNIGQLERKLSPLGFFRVHKSHLINLRHVMEYIRGKGGIAVMQDGSHVEISKRKREDFLLAVSRADRC